MARPKPEHELTPRISNRRALHDYTITHTIECGISLLGSEVKSVRLGQAQLTDAYALVEGRNLILHKAQIEPYAKAAGITHEPKRPRALLVHRRELIRLESETKEKGTTLVPIAMYFKDGRIKVELGVARGKQSHDKRATIREKEMNRDLRRIMSKRV
jgi:SsrA-binding protein